MEPYGNAQRVSLDSVELLSHGYRLEPGFVRGMEIEEDLAEARRLFYEILGVEVKDPFDQHILPRARIMCRILRDNPEDPRCVGIKQLGVVLRRIVLDPEDEEPDCAVPSSLPVLEYNKDDEM